MTMNLITLTIGLILQCQRLLLEQQLLLLLTEQGPWPLRLSSCSWVTEYRARLSRLLQNGACLGRCLLLVAIDGRRLAEDT